ncbi:hypothetical protein OPKNFCMD_4355 [Methylobacterium crusticola]|uniref:Uncharacterized protein n=1 Tax=Methylobacterium crusticola TaxID=1697972 RepID=A0ABQ4R1N5_9HYPH|nr:hypothetical protein [Methylobacterium crusticola]GJD51600.1 hypothetical protein OPKNFCMD_4355 [Methylobacterium crusticola]
MGQAVRRLGVQAMILLALCAGVLLGQGGREAAAVSLRPGLDPLEPWPLAAPARPGPGMPAPAAAAVRVILPLPWTRASAALAEDARRPDPSRGAPP